MSSPINTTAPPSRPTRSPLRPRTRSLASVVSPTHSEATSPTGSIDSSVLVCAGRNLQGSLEALSNSINSIGSSATGAEDSYNAKGLHLSSVYEVDASYFDEDSYFPNGQEINADPSDLNGSQSVAASSWTTVNEDVTKPASLQSISSSSSDEALTPFSSPVGHYSPIDDKPEIGHIEFGCSFNEDELAKALESKRSALQKYGFSSSTTACRASWTRSRSSLSTSSEGPLSPRSKSISPLQPRSPISQEISIVTETINQMNLNNTTKPSRIPLTIEIPTVAQTPKTTGMTRSFHLSPEMQTVVPPRRATYPSIELPSRPNFIRTRSGMTCAEGMQPLFSPSLRPLVMYSGLTAVMSGSNHNKTAGFFTSALQAAPKGPTPPSLLRRGSGEKVLSLSTPISPIEPTNIVSPTESTSTSASWMTIQDNSLELSPRPGTPRPDECNASFSFTAQGDKTFNPYFMEASMFA